MRTLTLKLILAFFAVSLVQAGLTAFFSRQAAERELDRFLREGELEQFISVVTTHYQAVGSWQHVAEAVRERIPPRDEARRRPPPANQPPSADRPPPPPPPREGRDPFALVDKDGGVVVAAGSYRLGNELNAATLADGVPIEHAGVIIGTVLPNPERLALTQREVRYLNRSLRSILYGGAMGLGIALVLVVAIARGVTEPLRRLTLAARTLARGEYGHQVPIRSSDEIRTLSQAFNQMSADLEEAIALRRRMTADIAHELRTPLTLIAGYIEAMRDGDFSPSPDNFEIMYDEAMHLRRLIEDLRTLSLADAGELSLQQQSVAPYVLLERTRTAFAREAQQKNITLTVETVPSLPLVWVDPGRMNQVLTNLVSNALRHTPEGGAITLTAQPSERRVALQICDTGPGLSAEVLPYIFDRFYRGDASRRQQHEESGLGLSIVRSLVEAHGGTINAESEPGSGATFTIVLPSASP